MATTASTPIVGHGLCTDSAHIHASKRGPSARHAASARVRRCTAQRDRLHQCARHCDPAEPCCRDSSDWQRLRCSGGARCGQRVQILARAPARRSGRCRARCDAARSSLPNFCARRLVGCSKLDARRGSKPANNVALRSNRNLSLGAIQRCLIRHRFLLQFHCAPMDACAFRAALTRSKNHASRARWGFSCSVRSRRSLSSSVTRPSRAG